MTWRNNTLRQFDLLVIIALVIFWYGVIPVAGAFLSRHFWRMFRRHFDEFRRKPVLDYRAYRQTGGEEGVYRFTGGFESITGDRILWLQGEDLTVPVALEKAHIYMMPTLKTPGKDPAEGGDAGGNEPDPFDPGEEAPERIRWNRISTLAVGVKVFVGGFLAPVDQRRTFVSTRETPLLVIFYDSPDRTFPLRTVRSGRHRNEYWNVITPYSFILGAFSQIMMVLAFLSRPAFQLTALTAFLAMFTPLFPLIPPGLLFTVLYRRLWWRARLYRAWRDLARLPLSHIPQGERTGQLPGGETYGAVYTGSLPETPGRSPIPLLLPPGNKKEGWYIFGVLSPALAPSAAPLEPSRHPPAPGGTEEYPAEPGDPLAVYGALPGNPETLARRFTHRAYILEVISWLVLLTGLGLNVFFIQMIISLLF